MDRAADRPDEGGTRVEIFTDGACRHNPGPGGWGALLCCGTHRKTIQGYAPHTTNNRMELLAAIGGLAQLKRPCRVVLTTDSAYLKNGITQWIHAWKRRGWRKRDGSPVLNADLWQRLETLAGDHRVEWLWVRGHAGHPDNETADQLATSAIDLGQTGALPPDPMGAPPPEPGPRSPRSSRSP
ncbi:MAG: ribonuclease HI [Magnetococcales bacterium]|nr:ribonuclease HI [Magnetococcales bacterium]